MSITLKICCVSTSAFINNFKETKIMTYFKIFQSDSDAYKTIESSSLVKKLSIEKKYTFL